MGNRAVCGTAPQLCADECARLQFETRSRDHDAEPDCDPAGAVFQETLKELPQLDREALVFAGTPNLAAVRWLLNLGANPKARDSNGTTLLHAACRSGGRTAVQELIAQGLPVDSPDSSGWTPLHIAAMMGRRDLTVLLLRVLANPSAKNSKGATPLALCSDPGTREVLEQFVADPAMKLPSRTPLSEVLLRLRGRQSDDFASTSCEPFFVPRVPLFYDEDNRNELVRIGLEMFSRSAGHGLAFLVATGVVSDQPTELARFLRTAKACPVQLGSFLGEDFSMAQTLRLAFVHSVDLVGTGVLRALQKAFTDLKAPAEFSKVDRLSSAVAHLWWRTHSPDEWDEGCLDEDEEAIEWTLYTEGTAESAADVVREVAGAKLRRELKSLEGLRRLMFSTVMLAWSLHQSHKPMSLKSWLELNAGMEVDGTDMPGNVQRTIYNSVAAGDCAVLLPEARRLVGSGKAEHQVQVGGSRPSAAPRPSFPGCSIKGWATVPLGGLERHELARPLKVSGSEVPRLAHCVLSENTGGFYVGATGGPLSFAEQAKRPGEEAVWLSLQSDLVLFLSTTPDDAAPYAFVRLQDAVLREVSRAHQHLILAGRLKTPRTGAAGPVEPILPFGDDGRHPLTLCFLLADGRFQPFEALWLELAFKTQDEVELWAKALGTAANRPTNPVEESLAPSPPEGPCVRLGLNGASALARLRSPSEPRVNPPMDDDEPDLPA